MRASAEVAGTCRRSARNRSNSTFVCLAPRREKSAAFALPATSIAKANPVRSGPTRLERNKCERMKSKLPHYGKLLLKDLLASGKNRVPTPSKIIVNVSSISCGGRGSVWRTATVLMHVNDGSYQSKRGQAMPLRLIPGRKGATDVEWNAGHRNGPCSSGR